MKVYNVTKSYFDGDHDHGYYESPYFATLELAEEFLAKIVATKEKHYPDPDYEKFWETDCYSVDSDPVIVE